MNVCKTCGKKGCQGAPEGCKDCQQRLLALMPFKLTDEKVMLVKGCKHAGKTKSAKFAKFKQMMEAKTIKFSDKKDVAQLYEQLNVSMTMARNTLTAIAQFDAMTHLGYKLNLITQQYHL